MTSWRKANDDGASFIILDQDLLESSKTFAPSTDWHLVDHDMIGQGRVSATAHMGRGLGSPSSGRGGAVEEEFVSDHDCPSRVLDPLTVAID